MLVVALIHQAFPTAPRRLAPGSYLTPVLIEWTWPSRAHVPARLATPTAVLGHLPLANLLQRKVHPDPRPRGKALKPCFEPHYARGASRQLHRGEADCDIC